MSDVEMIELPEKYEAARMYYSIAKSRQPVTVGRRQYAIVLEYLEWCKQNGVEP